MGSKKSIFILAEMLLQNDISFEFIKSEDSFVKGHQIIIRRNGRRLCDVVQNNISYGNDMNLLEIMDGLTEDELENDVVLGNLTVLEAFNRCKYCFDNNTTKYKK